MSSRSNASASHSADGAGVEWEEMASIFADLPSMLENTIERHGLGIDCPVCMETLPPFWRQGMRQVALCCGQWQCRSCLDERAAAGERAMKVRNSNNVSEHSDIYQLLNTCPLCRADLIKESETNRAIAHAEDGKAWARYWLSCQYLGNTRKTRDPNDNWGGYYPDRDLAKGRKYLRMAAAQGYPQAQHELGEAVWRGKFGFEESDEEARVYIERAASQGHSDAIYTLSYMYRDDKSDSVQGRTVKFIETLKAAAKIGNKPACLNLGYIYHTGRLNGSLKDPYPTSLEEASFYYEEGARPGEAGPVPDQIEEAANFYIQVGMRDHAIRHFTAAAKLGRWRSQFSLGCLLILRPSVSFIVVCQDIMAFNAMESSDFSSVSFPKGVYWLRRAAGSLGTPGYTRSLLSRVENAMEKVCFGCGSRAVDGKRFKRCVRCSVAHYCSKDCQVAHWHSQHRGACCKVKKKC